MCFGFSGAQQRTTWSTNGRPPAGCKTFASEDFRRVPLPAARITITTSLLGIVRLFSPALRALTIVLLRFWLMEANSVHRQEWLCLGYPCQGSSRSLWPPAGFVA